MAWLFVLLAGLLEVAWALGLKYSEGFSNFRWTMFTIITLAGSMALLGLALRSLPIGTAYAIWTGIGAVGTAILGMILFGEPRTALRIICILLIVSGIVGLRFATTSPA